MRHKARIVLAFNLATVAALVVSYREHSVTVETEA